jgi:hypothetical protein
MNEHDYKLCSQGTPLTPEQAHVMVSYCPMKVRLKYSAYHCLDKQKLLDMKTCEFKVTLKCVWHDGAFEKL